MQDRQGRCCWRGPAEHGAAGLRGARTLCRGGPVPAGEHHPGACGAGGGLALIREWGGLLRAHCSAPDRCLPARRAPPTRVRHAALHEGRPRRLQGRHLQTVRGCRRGSGALGPALLVHLPVPQPGGGEGIARAAEWLGMVPREQSAPAPGRLRADARKRDRPQASPHSPRSSRPALPPSPDSHPWVKPCAPPPACAHAPNFYEVHLRGTAAPPLLPSKPAPVLPRAVHAGRKALARQRAPRHLPGGVVAGAVGVGPHPLGRCQVACRGRGGMFQL